MPRQALHNRVSLVLSLTNPAKPDAPKGKRSRAGCQETYFWFSLTGLWSCLARIRIVHDLLQKLDLALLSHRDHYISLFLIGFNIAVGFDNLLQRILSINDRF